MARRQRKNIFGFGQKVTYHRDVAKERRELRRQALEDRKYALEQKRLKAQEKKDQDREDALQTKRAEAQERKEKAERKRADAVDRKIEREMREQGLRNPAESAKQYRLAQAVLSGTARAKSMTKKAAQEIVDRTPRKLRSLFMKSNPEGPAAELAEAFTGRPAETATRFEKTIHYHSVLTGLAPLMEIKIWVDKRHTRSIFFDKKKSWLGSAESGKQLYVEGKDLSIDVSAFGITGNAAEKDLIRIGDVYSVVYWTAKFHLGKADKIPGPYEHIFSEHGEEEPELIYDRLNQEPQFAGGEYHIPIDIDGKYSSGINN